MDYDAWKLETPPSGNFEDEEEEKSELDLLNEEIFEQICKINKAKKQLEELIEIVSQTKNNLVLNKLKQIKL